MESNQNTCLDTQTTLPAAHLVTHMGANEQVREVGLPSTCCLESVCSQKSLLESNTGKREGKCLQSLPKWLAKTGGPLKGLGRRLLMPHKASTPPRQFNLKQKSLSPLSPRGFTMKLLPRGLSASPPGAQPGSSPCRLFRTLGAENRSRTHGFSLGMGLGFLHLVR